MSSSRIFGLKPQSSHAVVLAARIVEPVSSYHAAVLSRNVGGARIDLPISDQSTVWLHSRDPVRRLDISVYCLQAVRFLKYLGTSLASHRWLVEHIVRIYVSVGMRWKESLHRCDNKHIPHI
jgi:hypothetical protein